MITCLITNLRNFNLIILHINIKIMLKSILTNIFEVFIKRTKIISNSINLTKDIDMIVKINKIKLLLKHL